jgi:hypothetical protein
MSIEHGTSDFVKLTQQELQQTVDSFSEKKAPGIDFLPLQVVKHMMAVEPGFILRIYDLCLRDGIFPKIWLNSNLILIPKPSKSKNITSNVRPICLLSVFGKVLDKLMYQRLIIHLEQHRKLSENQFGFRLGRSTENALEQMNLYIQSNISNDSYTTVVSLDIKGAFNHAWWPGIIERMVQYSCPNYLVTLVKSFCRERLVSFEHTGEYFFRKSNRGCPQGSVCGPLLWNLLFDEFLRLDFGSSIKVVSFADDCVGIISGKSRVDLVANTDRFLEMALEWTTANKLELNSEKTQVMIIGKPKKYGRGDQFSYLHSFTKRPGFKINGIGVQIVDKMKILGIIFDHKLFWTDHISYIHANINPIINNFKRFSYLKWGLRSLDLKLVYKTIFLPIVSYGCVVWSHQCVKVHFIRKVTSLQRQMLLQITRAYRTVSNVSIQLMSATIPLHLFYEFRKEFYNQKKRYNKYLVNCPPSNWKPPYHSLKLLPSLDSLYSFKPFTIFLTVALHGTFSVFVARIFDGSGHTIVKKRMETSAFYPAYITSLLYLFNLYTTTDYMYFIECHTIVHKTAEINRFDIGICNIHDYLSAGGEIYYFENPDVIPVTYLECKAMARDKDGIESVEQIDCYHSKDHLKRKILRIIYEKWQIAWVTSDGGVRLKTAFPTIDSFLESKLKDYINHFTCQFLTGHGQFAAYHHQYGRLPSPDCQVCGVQDTPEHVLFNCSVYHPFMEALREVMLINTLELDLLSLLTCNNASILTIFNSTVTTIINFIYAQNNII